MSAWLIRISRLIKNRISAQVSRDRKKQHMEALEAENARLLSAFRQSECERQRLLGIVNEMSQRMEKINTKRPKVAAPLSPEADPYIKYVEYAPQSGPLLSDAPSSFSLQNLVRDC